jgi:glycosyltransferase involved in cell wall biosynthesis
MKLSVVIPTYNRPEKLRNLLSQLDLSSVVPDEIIVINNASDLVYPDIAYKKINPIFIRNPINIGGVANLLRCYEVASYQWLWIIGDDDGAKENAIEIIKKDIYEFNEAATIFYSNYMAPIVKGFVTENSHDFMKAFEPKDFGGRLWISSAVYNRNFLKNSIQKMYEFPGSSPQMAWQLINSNKLCYFSKNEIAVHNVPNQNELWNVLKIQNQMTQLLLMPELDPILKSKLAEAVSNWYTGHDETLIRCCLEYCDNIKNPNKKSIIFAYVSRYVMAFLAMNSSAAAVEVINLYNQMILDENVIYNLAKEYSNRNYKKLSSKSFFDNH